MTRPVTDWYNDILPSAPGLTPGTHVDWAIADAAREFCERSRAWWVEHTINVVGNQHTYLIPGAKVVHIEQALYRGEEIPSTTEREQTQRNHLWRTEVGEVIGYLRPREQSIRLVRIPGGSLSAGLVVSVSVMPDAGASQLDDDLYDDHRKAIACGALSMLLAQPKKPWSDPGQAMAHRVSFEQAIGSAHVHRFNDRSTARRETRVIGGLD